MSALRSCVARSTIPALELDRAKRFYAETLGLEVELENPGGVVFRSGAGGSQAGAGWADQSTFLLFPTPNPARGGHTQMGFNVTDIDAVVLDLKSRGVTFLEYNLPNLKTENSVASILGGHGRAAWFNDTEGNIIGLVEFNS